MKKILTLLSKPSKTKTEIMTQIKQYPYVAL